MFYFFFFFFLIRLLLFQCSSSAVCSTVCTRKRNKKVVAHFQAHFFRVDTFRGGGGGKYTRFHIRPQPRWYTMFLAWWKHASGGPQLWKRRYSLRRSGQRFLGHTATWLALHVEVQKVDERQPQRERRTLTEVPVDSALFWFCPRRNTKERESVALVSWGNIRSPWGCVTLLDQGPIQSNLFMWHGFPEAIFERLLSGLGHNRLKKQRKKNRLTGPGAATFSSLTQDVSLHGSVLYI